MKSVVRLTDRPDMTLDVYRGRKTTIQQQQTFRTLDVSYPTLDILYPNAGRIVPYPWSIRTLPLFDSYPGPF